MSPPLISPYKLPFAYRRICQTFLGGLRLCSPPQYIFIQILIFSIPIPFVCCAIFTEYDNSEVILGICLFLIDVFISLVICNLKRSTRVGEIDYSANFLDQDDEIIQEGCFKASTWTSIAPNVSLSAMHFFAVFVSSFSFTLCSPVIFQNEWNSIAHTTLPPVWLRCLSIYTLCNARYSSVINLAPEIATFDSIKRRKDILYRPFYTAILGALLLVCNKYCSARSSEDTYEYETLSKLVISILLSILPLLWGFGILPPLDALLPWSLEMCIRFFGGNPSVNYIGTAISIIISALSFMMTLVAGSVSNQLVLIVLQCLVSYLVSSDAAMLLTLNASLCEDTPPQKLLWSILQPCAIILTSTISIMTYLLVGYHNEIILMSLALFMSVTSVIIKKIGCSVYNKRQWGVIPTNIFKFYNCLLKFVLHCWIAGELGQMESVDRYSLMNLLDYLFNIRAFARAITQSKYSSLDFLIAELVWRPYISDHKFTLIVFFVSILRSRIIRGMKYLKMVALFTKAAITSPLLSGMKVSIAAVSFITFPISLASLVLASILEGATLTPVFTLPIFLLAFPRPVSFWKTKWFANKKEASSEIKSLDNTIYSQIAPGIAKAIVGKARKTCLDMEEGSCYIARHEDRLIFLRVITKGWNYIYLQVKGLEMQEQTSCHHQESAYLDEIFESQFTNPSILKMVQSVKNSVVPSLELQLSGTYSESKSVVYQLKTREEKMILKGMFFRAFSYLWIDSNPVFKGESYSMRTNYQFSKLNVTEFQNSDMLEPISLIRAKSGQESIKGLTIKPKEAWNCPVDDSLSNNNQQEGPNFGIDTDGWIKLCVGQVIPSNAVKNRIEKLCESIWKFSDLSEYEGVEIELEQFFSESFEKKSKGFSSDENGGQGKSDIYDLTLKAFRYATKLSLDEIYNGPTTENLELFEQLSFYEREYGFVKLNDLPYFIQQKTYQHLVTMIKYEDKTILKMFSKEIIDFRVGQLNRFLVEGIWTNLNLELMYLTSDDDERFSIQHDRNIIRNICTQCANSPLGYPVFDSTYRISNCSVDMIY